MTATTISPPQKATQEELKQAIIALFKENNAEFKQLLRDFLSPLPTGDKKPKKQKTPALPQFSTQTEHIPYSEMPFWKMNPHLKPHDATPYAVNIEALKDLQAFFQEPGNEITDEWFEMLD